MNFLALEGLIQSIISSFSCESCNTRVEMKDVEIKAIEGKSVMIEINCPKCKHKSFIKSEVVSIDLTKYLSQEQLVEIKSSLEKNREPAIKDSQIVSLNKELKKENINVSDLFS